MGARARHALNEGQRVNVVVGLYKGSKSWKAAEDAGLTVKTVGRSGKAGSNYHDSSPDHVQPKIYAEEIKPNLKEGDALAFAHGFNIRFHQIVPPEFVDVFMVAPKGPGHLLRRMYVQGAGVPCLLAVEQDFTGNAKQIGLAYAKAIGGTRAGVIETTFAEETETDLFGEQCVLCGGVTELIKAGFDTLVEAGYQPEMVFLNV